MNYTPLDSLPYIDEEITDEQRDQIQLLINEDLETQDLTKIHSKVEELYPLPLKHPLISDLNEEDINNEEFTLGGIDLSKYSNLEDLDALKMSISYTYLKANLLKIVSSRGSNQWLISNDLERASNDRIEDAISQKRRKIEIVNDDRKQEQLENEPVLKFLESGWQQGIQSNVDIGIEILKLVNNVE